MVSVAEQESIQQEAYQVLDKEYHILVPRIHDRIEIQAIQKLISLGHDIATIQEFCHGHPSDFQFRSQAIMDGFSLEYTKVIINDYTQDYTASYKLEAHRLLGDAFNDFVKDISAPVVLDAIKLLLTQGFSADKTAELLGGSDRAEMSAKATALVRGFSTAYVEAIPKEHMTLSQLGEDKDLSPFHMASDVKLKAHKALGDTYNSIVMSYHFIKPWHAETVQMLEQKGYGADEILYLFQSYYAPFKLEAIHKGFDPQWVMQSNVMAIKAAHYLGIQDIKDVSAIQLKATELGTDAAYFCQLPYDMNYSSLCAYEEYQYSPICLHYTKQFCEPYLEEAVQELMAQDPLQDFVCPTSFLF
jgi:hypothetical protein